MRTHHLKTWPPFFEAALSREKPFEVREDDRGFAVGDTLVLMEWDPSALRSGKVDLESRGAYTGREYRVRVTYVLHGGRFGLEAGWVVMGTAPAPHE